MVKAVRRRSKHLRAIRFKAIRAQVGALSMEHRTPKALFSAEPNFPFKNSDVLVT